MFLESLGNFFTGRGLQTNKQWEEDDKKRKREREAAQAAKNNTQKTQNPTGPVRPNLGVDSMMLPTKPNQPATTNKMMTNPNKVDELAGISNEDRKIITDLRARGKNADGYIAAARNGAKVQREANNPLMVGEEVAKATGQVGRFLAGGALDWGAQMGGRVVETVDQAGSAVNRFKRDITGVSEQEKALYNKIDSDRFKGYQDFYKNADAFANTVAGTKVGTNEETEREMKNISSGKGNAGEIFSAALKSFGFEGPAAGVAARSAKTAPKLLDEAIFATEKALKRKLSDTEIQDLIKTGGDEAVETTADLLQQGTQQGVRQGEQTAAPTTMEEVLQQATEGAAQPQQPNMPTFSQQPPRGQGPATQSALVNIQNQLKRPLDNVEAEQIVNGQVPEKVVDEAAQIGSGISTPSTVQKAEADIANVAKVADAEANPALLPEPEATRPTLGSMFQDLMRTDGYSPGFARIPGKAPETIDNAADALPMRAADDIEPSAEDLARIDAEAPQVDELAPQNLEADFIREDIQRLANLARQRENAGVSEKSLDSIYAQIDAKEAELQNLVRPSKPSRAEAKAVEQNERVREAQANLERVVAGDKPAAPKKAPVVADVLPTKPKAQQVAANAAESLKPTKANKALQDDLEAISKMSDDDISETALGAMNKAPEVEAPTNATPKNKAVKEAKQEAINKETVKKAVSDKAKTLRKVNKKVDEATGKDTAGRAAPEVEKRLRRDIDDPDIRQALSNLGDSKQNLDLNKSVSKMLKLGVKRTDEQVQADINDVNFGLGEKASAAEKRIYAAYVAMPRLNRMMKAARASGDIKTAENLTSAYNNVAKTATSGASEAGQALSIESFLAKNAGPELAHARTKANFEKAGGTIDDATDVKFRESYESVYTAQKDLDTAKDAHAALLEKLAKGKKLTDKEIDAVSKDLKQKEDILENSLADNERIAGEIYDANVKANNIEDKGVGKFGPAYEGMRKSFMLSAPSGRIRDVFSSGFQVADQVMVDTLSGMFTGKSAKINGKAWAEGLAEGWKNLKQIASGEKRGGIYLDSGPEGLARKTKGAKTTLAPAPMKANKFVRVVNAASAAGTEGYRGYLKNRVLQMAEDLGKSKGYKGTQLAQFKKLTAAHPTDDLLKAAEQDFFRSSSMHKNFVYDVADWVDTTVRGKVSTIKDPKLRKAADLAAREISMLTMPFKKYAAGSIHRLLTDQNVFHNLAGVVGGKSLPGQAVNKASRGVHAARLTVNSGKIAVAGAALLPFMSDTDGNNESYSPPYIKMGDNYIPLASLGPVIAAPLGVSYAIKKATEKGGFDPAEYAKVYGGIMVQSTGADSILAGDSPIGRLITGSNGNRAEDGSDFFNRTGGRLLQDWGTQWIPAGFRDANSVIDGFIGWAGGNQYAPNTKVLDENGKRDYAKGAFATFGSAIPGVRQAMSANDPSEKANADFVTRILGASKASDLMKQSAADTKTKETIAKDKLATSTERITKLSSNVKIAGVLDDETKLLYERAQAGDKKLTQSELDSVESGIKKGEQKLLQSDDYDTYLAAVGSRREKLANDPSTAKKDLANIDYDINVAKTLKENKIPYDMFNLYSGSSKSGDDAGVKAGISNGELEDMLDPESPYFNREKANILLNIDQIMTKAGLSDNAVNSKVAKYAKALGGGGSGKGKGGDKVITDIGSVSKKTLNSEGPGLQYRDLKQYSSPIPNLSAQASKTNFKKNITVKRGVAL